MIKQLYVCDICRREYKPQQGFLADPQPILFQTAMACQNPLGDLTGCYQHAEYKEDHACDRCQRALAKAFVETVARLKADHD